MSSGGDTPAGHNKSAARGERASHLVTALEDDAKDVEFADEEVRMDEQEEEDRQLWERLEQRMVEFVEAADRANAEAAANAAAATATTTTTATAPSAPPTSATSSSSASGGAQQPAAPSSSSTASSRQRGQGRGNRKSKRDASAPDAEPSRPSVDASHASGEEVAEPQATRFSRRARGKEPGTSDSDKSAYPAALPNYPSEKDKLAKGKGSRQKKGKQTAAKKQSPRDSRDHPDEHGDAPSQLGGSPQQLATSGGSAGEVGGSRRNRPTESPTTPSLMTDSHAARDTTLVVQTSTGDPANASRAGKGQDQGSSPLNLPTLHTWGANWPTANRVPTRHADSAANHPRGQSPPPGQGTAGTSSFPGAQASVAEEEKGPAPRGTTSSRRKEKSAAQPRAEKRAAERSPSQSPPPNPAATSSGSAKSSKRRKRDEEGEKGPAPSTTTTASSGSHVAGAEQGVPPPPPPVTRSSELAGQGRSSGTGPGPRVPSDRDPIYGDLRLDGLTKEKRESLFWFIHQIGGPAAENLRLENFLGAAPVVFLQWDQYSVFAQRSIQSFLRQVGGRIPHIGDVPLMSPVDLQTNAARETLYQQLVGSNRTQYVSGTKVVSRPPPMASRRNSQSTSSTPVSARSVPASPRAEEAQSQQAGWGVVQEREPPGSHRRRDHSPPDSDPESSSDSDEDRADPSSSDYSSEEESGARAPPRSNRNAQGSSRSASRDRRRNSQGEIDRNQKVMQSVRVLFRDLKDFPFLFSGESAPGKERLHEWLDHMCTQLLKLINTELVILDNPIHHLGMVDWIAKGLSGAAHNWWNALATGAPSAAGFSAAAASHIDYRHPDREAPALDRGGDRQRAKGRRFTSVEEIREAFKERFSTPGSKEKAEAAINALSHRGEPTTEYNARFAQCAQNAKLGEEIHRFLYVRSMGAAQKTQMLKSLRDRKRSEDLLHGGYSLTELMTLYELAEYDLRKEAELQAHVSQVSARHGHSTSSSSSSAKGGYHHTSAPDLSCFQSLDEEHAYASEDQTADLNAMGGRSYNQSSRRRGDRSGQSYGHVHGAKEGSHGSTPHKGSGSGNSRGGQQSGGAGASSHSKRQSLTGAQSSGRGGPHTKEILVRGKCALAAAEMTSLVPKVTDAIKNHPWLAALQMDVLASRIKQNLCWTCGHPTKEGHTTATCRGRSHLN